jgi:hypothetical protein
MRILRKNFHSFCYLILLKKFLRNVSHQKKSVRSISKSEPEKYVNIFAKNK